MHVGNYSSPIECLGIVKRLGLPEVHVPLLWVSDLFVACKTARQAGCLGIGLPGFPQSQPETVLVDPIWLS